ncbi:hypothetical protein BIT28_14175 [Photobacterium proteolyticum]|uniref:Uncharacterized protein n=1 Tax=Photobacterium proteolyticum TaxID=1903952 RepID=A0A1Q9H1X0_9GAMM|nr:hypothetical protein [Photobacterium proteolyticum]OLQ81666.1 hypothetical protein BIT28_14175 [Photobacterium proteolyticum]
MSLPPIVAAKIVVDITKVFFDYAKCVEQEKTKRLKIAAALEVQIKTIQAQEKVFSDYLDKAFAEREKLYKSVESAVQQAVSMQDHVMLKLCLEFKISVYNKDALQSTSSLLGVGSTGLLGESGSLS